MQIRRSVQHHIILHLGQLKGLPLIVDISSVYKLGVRVTKLTLTLTTVSLPHKARVTSHSHAFTLARSDIKSFPRSATFVFAAEGAGQIAAGKRHPTVMCSSYTLINV